MNRNEKRTLKAETRRFDSSVRLAFHLYGSEIEERIDREQDKLDSLPEQIRNSVTGEQIEESACSLKEISDKLEDIETVLDDILSLAETSSIFKAPSIASTRNISQGRKGITFHAIFPSSLIDRLKKQSLECGLSMNEIVCRALTEAFDKEEKLIRKH